MAKEFAVVRQCAMRVQAAGVADVDPVALPGEPVLNDVTDLRELCEDGRGCGRREAKHRHPSLGLVRPAFHSVIKYFVREKTSSEH